MSEAADDAPDLAIDVVRGAPTPEEVAALIAVVSEAYTQEADRATDDAPARSAWEISARGLRTQLSRERGWSGLPG